LGSGAVDANEDMAVGGAGKRFVRATFETNVWGRAHRMHKIWLYVLTLA